MRTTLQIAVLLFLTFCSTTQTKEEQTNSNPITNIQHSEKYERGIEAFPYVLTHDDTVNITEPMYGTAVLNSKMYQDLVDYENLELSYLISVGNKVIWNSGLRIETSDTMNFEVRFDTLNINSDSLHLWRFLATARFEREGKFFYDTTALFDKEVFLKVD